MSSLLRPTLLLALVSLAVASSLPGCSQQGEGERCDLIKNGDADCDSGLVCTASSRLRDHSTDRCCAPNNASSDARCDPATPFENIAGAGGEGAEPAPGGGSGGSGGTAAGSGGTTAGSSGSGGTMMSTGGVPDSGGNGGQSEGGALSSDPSAGRGGA